MTSSLSSQYCDYKIDFTHYIFTFKKSFKTDYKIETEKIRGKNG